MKKLLAVSTSPRTNGNSESALDMVLQSVEDTFMIEKVRLKDMDIAPCQGCGFCEKSGECIKKDDAPAFMQKMLEADVLILATPVYAMSVSAQAKILIDRCQMLWARKYLLHTLGKYPDKRGVFIAAAGQTNPEVFEHTVPVARFLFDVCGVQEKNMQYVLLPGLDKKGEFLESEAAKAIVRDAAETLKALCS